MKKEVSPVLMAVIIIVVVVVVGAFGYKFFMTSPSHNKAEDAKHEDMVKAHNMSPEQVKALGPQMNAAEQEMARKMGGHGPMGPGPGGPPGR